MELILLAFVWDKNASGKARSDIENGLPSSSDPPFIMGQDCLWKSEEHTVGDFSPRVPLTEAEKD